MEKQTASDSIAENQPATVAEQSEQPDSNCRYCGAADRLCSEPICSQCFEQILSQHLPKLKRELEYRYGEMLDRFLAGGGCKDIHWEAIDEFEIRAAPLKRVLCEIVQEAVAKEEIILSLDEREFWKPVEIEELMEHLLAQCVGDLQRIIKESIIRALVTCPTRETEREIVEIAVGKKRSQNRRLRDKAIMMINSTKAFDLLEPFGILMMLRYSSDQGRCALVEFWEERIDPVWNHVKELLPEELVRLIGREIVLGSS